jgi:hypothetical protein
MALRRRIMDSRDVEPVNEGFEGPMQSLDNEHPRIDYPQPPPPESDPAYPADGWHGAPSRLSETSRERGNGPDVSLRGAAQATPTMPKVPTPMAGKVSPASSGVLPFTPMGGGGPSVMLRSPGRQLFGSLGGLKGGGLGIPMDPTNDAASDPISTLIKMLKGGR